jgi:hypothetical protein
VQRRREIGGREDANEVLTTAPAAAAVIVRALLFPFVSWLPKRNQDEPLYQTGVWDEPIDLYQPLEPGRANRSICTKPSEPMLGMWACTTVSLSGGSTTDLQSVRRKFFSTTCAVTEFPQQARA